ncbi:MAG: DUF4093 domain-containing protein, partial [Clostridia bacterium]|nr:DUF4093 domain-containing protein [Clostridia bacterium]
MVKIKEAIVVEGRYDKNTLSQVVHASIFETNGFGVMNDRALLSLLRQVAEKRGLIILTDSDGGGFVIRNFLKSSIDPKFVKHAYIPDIFGKEKRKKTAGKEGKLGVEGMTPEIIIDRLRAAGATIDGEASDPINEITKQDLMELGLSGCKESSILRKKLLQKLALPEHLSANGMLQA